MLSSKPKVVDAPASGRRRIRPAGAAIPLAILLCVAVAAVILGPAVLWPYHLVRGAGIMERAIEWPEPRTADALPALRDAGAARMALQHFQAASDVATPGPNTLRRMAHLHAALANWSAAAAALERARAAQPKDPLLAWELALMYEQQLRELKQAPRENIVPDLLSAPIEAPADFITTSFCEAGRPETCYVASQHYTQAFAGDAGGEQVTLDGLFMYPPAAVSLTRQIYAGHAVLSFAMGLDPNMHNANSDGAGFEVWITPQNGDRRRVFDHLLDRETAAQGWVPGQVDLSAWAGQQVTLELRTTGGPAGDTTDDWYAWGDVSLTTPQAAGTSWRVLERRIERLWNIAGLDAGVLIGRADRLMRAGDFARAAAWYARAAVAEPKMDPATYVRAAVASVVANGKLPAGMHGENVGALPLETEVQIPAPELRLAYVDAAGAPRYDELVNAYPTNEPNVGTLWWDGAAFAMVDVAAWRNVSRHGARPA